MLQQAHDFYNKRDFLQAFKLYKQLADSGDSAAQTSLAFMYQRGESVEIDIAKAFELYEKAIVEKQPYALFNLAIMYQHGNEVVQKDEEKAHKLFLDSAIAGVHLGQYQVGLLFEKGIGCIQNYSEAAFWYEEAAKRGHGEAFNNLGVLYKEGLGVEQNYHRAHVCFSRACEKDISTAYYNLGQLYDGGLGVEIDHEKALELCRKAAFGGHQKAKNIIKKLQESGKIVF